MWISFVCVAWYSGPLCDAVIIKYIQFECQESSAMIRI